MSAKPDVRAQLQSLRIATDQRPGRSAPAASTSPAATPRRRGIGRVVALVLLAAVVAGTYVYRDHLTGVTSFVSDMGDKIGDATRSVSARPPVHLIAVTSREATGPGPALTATGKIFSDHIVSVATKVSGQIVRLHFEQGDVVKKDQLLAEIEDVNYKAHRDHAKAMHEKARADLEFQRVNFARVEDMNRQEVSRPIETAAAKKALDEAVAQAAADEAQLAFAQKALNDTKVLAPIAGTILERNVEVGDFIAAEGGRGMMANSLFARIADMSMLRVEVDVSELDITRLRKDMPATITPDAYKDRTYPGHIMWIDPGANYSKATVQVKVRIDKPDAFLRIEGTAKVLFFVDDPRAASKAASNVGLWIPKSACITNPDGKTAKVFVERNGRIKAAAVTLGRITEAEAEVISGLSAGERIAADGLDKLTDGQKLKSPAL